jgi:hypothetical protein
LKEHEAMEHQLGTPAAERPETLQLGLFGALESRVAQLLRETPVQELSDDEARAFLLRLRQLL